MNATFPIRRTFVDVAHGQMLCRQTGDGDPLLVFHASPGSSRQQLSLIADLAGDARVIAPDTPGNGDSDALPLDQPTIVDLANAMIGLIEALGLTTVNLYGSHTGAAIAAEFAIQAPDRVGRVILDGVSNARGAALERLLARYAFPFEPDLDAAYLMRAWHFCRDQWLFYPWFDRTRAAQRDNGLASAADLNGLLVEVLKAGETYHRNYRAAFRWDAEGRLPLVGTPTLVLAAENDPLHDQTVGLMPLLRNARLVELPRFDSPDFASNRANAIRGFLRGQ